MLSFFFHHEIKASDFILHCATMACKPNNNKKLNLSCALQAYIGIQQQFSPIKFNSIPTHAKSILSHAFFFHTTNEATKQCQLRLDNEVVMFSCSWKAHIECVNVYNSRFSSRYCSVVCVYHDQLSFTLYSVLYRV